jgi:hypothetical protein
MTSVGVSARGAWALVFLSFSSASCSDDPGVARVDAAAEELLEGVPPVPAMIAPPASHEIFEPPELCVWAASMDALILGKLVSVRLAETPAVEIIPDYDLPWNERWRYVEDCAAPSPALVLEVDVHEALRGDLEGRVEVWMGQSARSSLAPTPAWDAEGEFAWLGPSRDGQPLRVGQMIGLPLHFVAEEEVWSVVHEAMFGLEANGRISFQRRRGFEPAPADADGRGRESFAEAVSVCLETSASEERRAAMRWTLEGPPNLTRAALCRFRPRD